MNMVFDLLCYSSSFFESHLAERLSNHRGSITDTCESRFSKGTRIIHTVRPVDTA